MGEQRLLFPTEAGLLLLVHLCEEEDIQSRQSPFVCFLFFLAGFFIDDLSVLYQCFIFN